ncbi:MAG: O-antigen ligase family protein [Puniceicoccales bacterium]|jgi:tetratricopeptide (TPR) repeat protein|nr:O-antigen ligase family protein [Puniceicoccales bacterium]
MLWARKTKFDLEIVFCGLFFVLAAIYPARRFVWEYACLFKAFYLVIIVAGTYGMCVSSSSFPKSLVIGFGLLLFAFWASIFLGPYPVRSASELDIPLASMSLAYLFCSCLKHNFKAFIRLLGITFVFFMYFSICLDLACDELKAGPTYPWQYMASNCLINPIKFLTILDKYQMRHPFDYTNYTGLFAALTYPFFAGLFMWESLRKWKVVWCIGFLLSILLLKASECSMAYLCVLITTITALGLYIKSHIRASKSNIIKVSICLLAFLLLMGYRSPKTRSLFAHPKCLFQNQRWHLAQDGLKVFRDSPLIGHGITTTPLLYLKSYPTDLHHCWQLHVAPVQYLIEWGLLGFLGLCTLALTSFQMSFRLLKKKEVPAADKFLVAGLGLSLFAYVCFVSEWSWDIFAVSATLCLIVGLLWTIYFKCFPAKRHFNTPTTLGIKLLILMMVGTVFFYSYKDIQGRYYFRKFIQQTYNTQLEKSEIELSKAIEADPTNLYYYNQAGNVFALKGYPQSSMLMRHSVYYFESSLKINPWQPYVLENLGALHTRLGNYRRALQCYCEAIRLLPYHSLAYIQLVAVLLHCHQFSLASEWLGLAAYVQPYLLSQPAFNKFLMRDARAQKKCLDYYHYVENTMDSTLKNNDHWTFSKYIYARLFNQSLHWDGFTDQQKQWLQGRNWIYYLSFDNLYEESFEARPFPRDRHALNNNQHSSLKVILHGHGGPSLFTCTLQQIYTPNEKCKLAQARKCAHQLLKPVIQKTVSVF